MTPAELVAASGCSVSTSETFAPAITAAAAAWGIDSPTRLAHFVAQTAHESALFTELVEDLNYSAAALVASWPHRFRYPSGAESVLEVFTDGLRNALQFERQPEKIADVVYSGRMGNTQPGDGWLYRGRGLIQITGHVNYGAYFAACGDVIGQPDLLDTPTGAADSAAWFWHARGLNRYADAGSVTALTVAINGGTNGLQSRQFLTTRALAALKG